MLTLRTSAHITTHRHLSSFRLCPASTGVALERAESSRLFQEWTRLLDAESRRSWLECQWSAHQRRVRSSRNRRQS